MKEGGRRVRARVMPPEQGVMGHFRLWGQVRTWQGKGVGPLGAGRGQEDGSPLEPSEGSQPLPTPQL